MGYVEYNGFTHEVSVGRSNTPFIVVNGCMTYLKNIKGKYKPTTSPKKYSEFLGSGAGYNLHSNCR